MTLDQAERLQLNEDFQAFLKVVAEDIESIKEDLVFQPDPAEVVRVQCKIQVLRGIQGRLGYIIESLSPEDKETPASAQGTVSPA